MKQKKRIDLHLILKYGRPLICFVLVVSFIFVYSLNVFADGVNETWMSKYGSEGVMPRFNMSTAITNWGGDIQQLPRTGTGIQYFPYLLRTDYNIGSGTALYSVISNYNTYCSALNYDHITYNNTFYDLSNTKKILTGAQDNSAVLRAYYFWVDDYSYDDFVICNGYVLSEQPFKVCSARFYSNGNVQASYLTPTSVSGTRNGYYIYELNGATSFSSALFYAEMPIYISSSDGSTGFTKFYNNSSSEATNDFSFDDLDSYYNFNYLYVEPDPEPEPEPEPVILGQYYNYAYVDGYIRPTSETDIGVNLSFSFNDYMRLHPNEYEIRFQWYATLTGNNLPSAYGSNYFESVNSLPLSTITGYNGWNQGGNNSQFRYSTTVNALKNSSDKSLKDAFEQIYIQGGGTANTYNGFSIIDFVREFYTGLSSETVGKWVIRGNFTSVLTKITLGCKISIIWVGGEPETTGGKLWITYDTESGSNIVSNDLGVNFNPPEEYSPEYPAEISDSNGNIIVNSGGSNITVNPTTYSNFNAIIEYLYHLDAQQFLALAGNNQNAVQYALNTLSSTESNGFFPVLKRTFDIIPDQIWDWIKVSFAVILGGAILGISYRMVRWR